MLLLCLLLSLVLFLLLLLLLLVCPSINLKACTTWEQGLVSQNIDGFKVREGGCGSKPALQRISQGPP